MAKIVLASGSPRRQELLRNIGITEANAFLSHPDILLSTDLIKSIVEKALVKHVKEAHSLNQYHQLLSVLNESNPAYQEAYHQVEIMEFEANCGTIEGCRFYLTNYPKSPLIEQAKQKKPEQPCMVTETRTIAPLSA